MEGGIEGRSQLTSTSARRQMKRRKMNMSFLLSFSLPFRVVRSYIMQLQMSVCITNVSACAMRRGDVTFVCILIYYSCYE